MKYIVDTTKTIDQVSQDLQDAVKAHNFGVLHTYDLKETLKTKGIDLPNECRIFEICNPGQAAAVLAEDMALNMALPCRLSVWETGDNHVKIGMISPVDMLGHLSDSSVLKKIAAEVEDTMKTIIQTAK
ncbi:MAG: DUF302 domain-containing protein [Rhodospirillales bacterium]|nr:DUF302 domain-containing protein [Rhodospirillales bacterium]MCB9980580.1 DUF302 domain-containing protein [Rhodospirillales bacterium]